MNIVLKKNKQWFYLDMLCISLFLFGIVVQSSMLMYVHDVIPKCISLICLSSRFYFLVSFFLKKTLFSKNQLILYFIFVSVAFLLYYTTGIWCVYDLFFISLFQQEYNSQKVKKTILMVLLFSVIFIMLCYFLHIMPDIHFVRNNGRKRYGFGFSHPNGFSRMIFLIVLIDVLIKKQNVKYREIVVYILLAVFVYEYPNTVTAAGLIAVVSFTLLVNKVLKNRLSNSNVVMLLMCIMMLVITISFISLAILYSNGKIAGTDIPETIESRFILGMRGYDKYGIEWMGNKDVSFVSSAASSASGEQYFVLDSLIFYLPIRMGLAVTALFIVFYVCSVVMYFIKRNFFGIMVMMSVCIYSLFENAILTSYAFMFAFLFFDAYHKGRYYNIEKLIFKRLKIENKYKNELHISDDI